jgi:hypothetical protein
MAVFQHVLWGYELTYPDNWVHRTLGNVEGFAPVEEALDEKYQGEQNGHLLVRAEWNGLLQDLQPLWNQHIGLTAGMLGAKNVGAAPWSMGGAQGLEAEIALPKSKNQRLWAGILGRGALVLQFMVLHTLSDRAWFEPLFTSLISSLRFPASLPGLAQDDSGLPLPPGYAPVPPAELVSDIADPHNWRAYRGASSIGALQAFYLREGQHNGRKIESFDSFPGDADLGFARFELRCNDTALTLGLLPYGEERVDSHSPANLVIRIKEGK